MPYRLVNVSHVSLPEISHVSIRDDRGEEETREYGAQRKEEKIEMRARTRGRKGE
jgi:hypothetical protein